MGVTGISKSQVSKLCKDIDERIMAFLERPLEVPSCTAPTRSSGDQGGQAPG
jgi:Transposase, Mutator family